jgi:aryl-alcohol dehydrogenase-like predicted oxidoreductase
MQFLRKDAGGARRAEGRAAGDVARAWLLSQPAVTAPIIGPRTEEQLRALDVEVDEPTLIRLHEVVPGRRTALEDCGS